MFVKHPLAALLPFYIAAVNAANDWSVPCTSGICEWDTKNGETIGNIIVTAATNALSDITPAAGWHILDCDPDSLGQQTIRLVCESEDAGEAGCDALLEGGAENTIVRLPNSCGGGPFARLARIWESPDQQIPDEARRKFRKRAAPPGAVQNAIVDFDFAQVPATPGNDVDILATGSNNKLAPVQDQAARLRRAYSSQKMRRAVLKKPRPPGTPATAPKPTAAIVKEFLQKLGELNKLGIAKTGGVPVSVHKKAVQILNNEVSCAATARTPPLAGSLILNVDADVEGTTSYGFAVEGKIVPPKLDDVGFYAAFTGNASALWHITATAEAEVLTKRLEVVNVPLSPLSIPGVVNIGPKFSLGLSAIVKLGLTGKMDIGTTLNMPKLEMRFPPKQTGPSAPSSASAVKAPLKVNVTPQLGIGGAFEGHITPRLALGVDMISGFAKAEVFLEADIKGGIELGIEVAKNTAPANQGKLSSVSGCIGLTSAIKARAGAEGSITPFFDQVTGFDIFAKDFPLFKKCFTPGQGNSNSTAPAASKGAASSSKAALPVASSSKAALPASSKAVAPASSKAAAPASSKAAAPASSKAAAPAPSKVATPAPAPKPATPAPKPATPAPKPATPAPKPAAPAPKPAAPAPKPAAPAPKPATPAPKPATPAPRPATPAPKKPAAPAKAAPKAAAPARKATARSLNSLNSLEKRAPQQRAVQFKCPALVTALLLLVNQ